MRFALTDPPVVLSADASLEELTGFSAEDWISSRVCLQDRIHPEDKELLDGILSPELAEPCGYADLRIRHADGRIRPLHVSFTKERATDGTILQLQLTRPCAAVSPELESIAHCFGTLMDHTDDAMYLKNEDQVYVRVTRAMARLLEDPGAKLDFAGKTAYDVYPETLADALFRRDEDVFKGGRDTHEVQRVQVPDGSHRWIDNRKYPLKSEDGRVVGLFGICPDITEPIDAWRKLGETNELFQLFIEYAPAAIAMFDREMRYIAASRRWIQDYGLAGQDLTGRSHYEIFPEIPERWKALHQRALNGEDLYCDEDRFVRADFTVQWLRWELHSWRTAEGSIGGLLIFTEDITQQKKDKEQLQLAASVFTNAREGIVICDPGGAILDVNEMFTRITGYSRAEALGRNPRLLKSGRQSEEFYADMWRSLTEKGNWSGELWNKAKDGRIYPEALTINAVYDRTSKVQHYVAHFTDISEMKEQARQLERMAHFDALTNLPNRALLTDRLQQAMAQARQRGQMLAVVSIDLDGFRLVNEGYGQDAGDQLLMGVAQRMKQMLPETDSLARIGGDEFVAVLQDLANADAVKPMMRKLLACASEPEICGENSVQVSASIGVVLYPQAEEIDAEQLLRQAGQAMYQSKLAGKNRYQIFDPTHDITVRTFHEDLEQIGRGLAADEFVLHYQPRVHMSTGALMGAEALIRWNHPTRGRLLPAEFLPVIESHPLIDRIGEWVIDHALTQLERWNAAGLKIPVSVNIAAHHLQQPDFTDRLRALLAEHAEISPSRLELEVLETSALRDVAQVSGVLAACRDLGVSIALDDFGTGYSSLTYFKRLPVNTLKIDRSFVRDVLDDPEDLSILEGVLGLATAFDRMAIAEGVETADHGRLLLQLGCVYGQGNGIALPMPGDELPGWSSTWNPDPMWVNVASVAPRKRSLMHAAVAHRAWVAGLEGFLQGTRRTPPTLDPHRCRLGRWLDSERDHPMGSSAAFRRIEQLHQETHAFADVASAWEPSATGADVSTQVKELHRLRDALIEQMNSLLQDTAAQ
ncbi:MAG TPA: EAL domain-containing protein [Acidobacteriaceae bacterium]|nr:EAL domain-containing protein [Acidobacteriaceae bacterium]